MKVGVIIPNNIWFCPFARIYTRMLDSIHVSYELVSWNRDGNDFPEGRQYNKKLPEKLRPATLSEYIGFAKFVKTSIKEGGYDRLIIIGPHIPCLLSAYLLKWKGKFIIDYRDLSIDQRPIFKQVFAFMLRRSYANVISSPGFRNFLPKGKYYISHNFNVDAVRAMISDGESEHKFHQDGIIDVLTIGGIRDYESNIEIVKSLANIEGFKCRFVGKGIAAEQIETYCKDNEIHNVTFKGRYEKAEEVGFVEDATFLNIFYPRSNLHDSAISNRFYNSLLYKRPMIVTKNTTQGNLAEDNGVGVVIENGLDLPNCLRDFLKSDYEGYATRCNELLASFLKDQEQLEEMIKNFLS